MASDLNRRIPPNSNNTMTTNLPMLIRSCVLNTHHTTTSDLSQMQVKRGILVTSDSFCFSIRNTNFATPIEEASGQSNATRDSSMQQTYIT
jgi:hypothetical protein